MKNKKINIDLTNAPAFLKKHTLTALNGVKKELEDAAKSEYLPPYVKREDILAMLNMANKKLEEINGTNTSESD